MAEDSGAGLRVSEAAHKGVQAFPQAGHAVLAQLTADAHREVIGPREGPGIAFKLLEELHPQQITAARQVVAVGQHEIAGSKGLRQRARRRVRAPRPEPDNPPCKRRFGLPVPAAEGAPEIAGPVFHHFRARRPRPVQQQVVQLAAGKDGQGLARPEAQGGVARGHKLNVLNNLGVLSRLSRKG